MGEKNQMNNLLITIISSSIAFSAGFLLKGRLDSGQEAKTQLQASNVKYEHMQQNIATDQKHVQTYLDQTQKQQVVYKTIYKERIKYVKEHPNDNPYLASFWVCSIDSAAGMHPFDCLAYAATVAPSVRIDAAEAVIQHNYEICNETRTQLINLIDLIKEENHVK